MKPTVHFTNHAKDRFKERFPHLIVDAINKSLAHYFYAARPDKTFLNNTKFMLHLQEKYGYDPLDFRVTDDIVFVCRENVLITLYSRHESIFGRNRARFRKTR